jgi:20S proteasome alpha/beta subunit
VRSESTEKGSHFDGVAIMVFVISLFVIIVNALICLKSQIFVCAAGAAGTETLIGITGNGFVLLAADMGISSNGVAFTSTSVDKIHQLHPNALIAAVGDAADTDRLVSLLRAECNIYKHESFGSLNYGIELINCITTAGEDDYSTSTSSPLISKITETSAPSLSVDCIAEMARHKVAELLRTSTPFRVCGLIAGIKRSDKPEDQNCALSQHVQHQLLTATSLPEKSKNADENMPPVECDSEVSLSRPLLFWLDEYGSLVANIPYGVHGYASDMLWSILDNGYQPNMSLVMALRLLNECIHQLKARYVMNSQSQNFCVKYLDERGCHTIDFGSAE